MTYISKNAGIPETALCKLAYKYGTDKCPRIKHAYTPFYYKLFMSKRNNARKVLEFGIGNLQASVNKPITHDRTLNRNFHLGASLKMWRDFFPNAQVFGADIAPQTQFSDKRIKTYICDERNEEDLKGLIDKIGGDIDIIIDDASHHAGDQAFLAKTLLPLLKMDVIYVIEDVGHTKFIRNYLGDIYNYEIPSIPRPWKGGMLLVITKNGTI